MTCSNCKRENVFLMSEDNLCTRCYAPCRFRQFPHDGRLLDDPRDPSGEIRRFFQHVCYLMGESTRIQARIAKATASKLAGREAQNYRNLAEGLQAFADFVQTCTPATMDILDAIERSKSATMDKLSAHNEECARLVGGVIVSTPEILKLEVEGDLKRREINLFSAHPPRGFSILPSKRGGGAGLMTLTDHIPTSYSAAAMPPSAVPTSMSSFLVSRMHFPHSAQVPQSHAHLTQHPAAFPSATVQHIRNTNCPICLAPLQDPSKPPQSVFTNQCGHAFHAICIGRHLKEFAAPRGGTEEILQTTATCPMPGCGMEIISIRDPRARTRPQVRQPALDSDEW